MFVHFVKTPRNIDAQFGVPDTRRRNQISLLTGPNGSGKTDVLASIARVFHGPDHQSNGSLVRWSKRSDFRSSSVPMPRNDENRVRVRLIAQTFSPFSRFPPVRRTPSPRLAPVYAQGDESEEEYVCVGFNQRSRVGLHRLSLSIVENGILRLSERPTTAKVAFDVLEELGFKGGIELTYLAHRHLSLIIAIADEPNQLERLLQNLARVENFIFANAVFESATLRRLRREVRTGDVTETAEYLRHAINLANEYLVGTEYRQGSDREVFRFLAFRGRQEMTSDFAYLQAFSVLARLGLLEVTGCTLTPIAGESVDLTHASSGQQQMLCSIFGLAAALEDHSLVLIDEPELSLHPRWQMSFLKHLETALEAVQECHVIIATHSPLIAQAAARLGAQTIAMDQSPQSRVSPSQSQRGGTSVEEVLVDVFETPIPNSLHISNEIFGLVTKAESGSKEDKLHALEQLEKYMLLYRHDGDGSLEMTSLLSKAMNLVAKATPDQANPGGR